MTQAVQETRHDVTSGTAWVGRLPWLALPLGALGLDWLTKTWIQAALRDGHPRIIIPAGNYKVMDSKPQTWSQNDGSQGSGFTRIEGYRARGE